MAKSNNQKAKILFLEHMLRGTGENRTVSMQEILDQLSERGITAERKSVYDDMEALRVFGMDVRFKRGRPGGYYLAGQMASEEEAMPVAEGHTEKVDSSVKMPDRSAFVRNESYSDKKMKLICEAESEKQIKEYFGDAAEYSIREDGYIQVTSMILSDAQFFGWLTAMGTSVKVVKPKKVGQAYRDYLKTLAREYKGI